MIRRYLKLNPRSMAQTVREMGLSEGRLRNFLAGAEFIGEEGDERARVLAWCEQHGPRPFLQAEEIAMILIARWAPLRHRRTVRERIAAAVIAEYDRLGIRLSPVVREALART